MIKWKPLSVVIIGSVIAGAALSFQIPKVNADVVCDVQTVIDLWNTYRGIESGFERSAAQAIIGNNSVYTLGQRAYSDIAGNSGLIRSADFGRLPVATRNDFIRRLVTMGIRDLNIWNQIGNDQDANPANALILRMRMEGVTNLPAFFGHITNDILTAAGTAMRKCDLSILVTALRNAITAVQNRVNAFNSMVTTVVKYTNAVRAIELEIRAAIRALPRGNAVGAPVSISDGDFPADGSLQTVSAINFAPVPDLPAVSCDCQQAQ